MIWYNSTKTCEKDMAVIEMGCWCAFSAAFLSSTFTMSSGSFVVGVVFVVILCLIGGYWIRNKGYKTGFQHGTQTTEDKLSHKFTKADELLSKAQSRECRAARQETIAAEKLTDANRQLKEAEDVRRQAAREELDAYTNGLKKKDVELRRLLHDVLAANPDNQHIAQVLSDAEAILFDKAIEDSVGWRAQKTAAQMRKRFNESCRRDRFNARFYKYQTELYQYLVPKLAEYATSKEEMDTDALRTDESDWLSEDEFNRLSNDEKSQLALERYINSKKKSRWQIGRDYELYVGHIYRRDGWNVAQKGIEDGINDLGRDLICKKGNIVHIVQCKYWSQEKVIHEKHIAQLYGTAIAYKIEHELLTYGPQMSLFPEDLTVVPVFVTSTELSERAKFFAKTLGVELQMSLPLGEFPRIKCNISADGERIFHLPFDQQYDRTIISGEDEDCYAFTVKEAISMGFRRAKRHFYGEVGVGAA